MAIIVKDKNIKKLIGSVCDKFIRIWNFQSAELINKIKEDTELIGKCLWNENYIFTSDSNSEIKLIDI